MKSSKIGHYLKIREVAPKEVINSVESYKDRYKLAFYYVEVTREYSKALSIMRRLVLSVPNYIPDYLAVMHIAGKYDAAKQEALYYVKRRKHEVRIYALLSSLEKDIEMAIIYIKAAKYLYLARKQNDRKLIRHINKLQIILELKFEEEEGRRGGSSI